MKLAYVDLHQHNPVHDTIRSLPNTVACRRGRVQRRQGHHLPTRIEEYQPHPDEERWEEELAADGEDQGGHDQGTKCCLDNGSGRWYDAQGEDGQYDQDQILAIIERPLMIPERLYRLGWRHGAVERGERGGGWCLTAPKFGAEFPPESMWDDGWDNGGRPGEVEFRLGEGILQSPIPLRRTRSSGKHPSRLPTQHPHARIRTLLRHHWLNEMGEGDRARWVPESSLKQMTRWYLRHQSPTCSASAMWWRCWGEGYRR